MRKYTKIAYFFAAFFCCSMQLNYNMNRLKKFIRPLATANVIGVPSARSFATQDVSHLTSKEKKKLAEENKENFLFKPEGERHYGKGQDSCANSQ